MPIEYNPCSPCCSCHLITTARCCVPHICSDFFPQQIFQGFAYPQDNLTLPVGVNKFGFYFGHDSGVANIPNAPYYMGAPTGSLTACWKPATGIPCFGPNAPPECWKNTVVFESGNLFGPGTTPTGWDYSSLFSHNPNTELFYLWSYKGFNPITGNPPIFPSGFPPSGVAQFLLWGSGNYTHTCCNALNYDDSLHGPYPNYLPVLPPSSVFISTSGVFKHNLCVDQNGFFVSNPFVSGANNLQIIYINDSGSLARTLGFGEVVNSPLCGASGLAVNSPCYSTIQWVDPSGYTSALTFTSGVPPLSLGYQNFNLGGPTLIRNVNFTPQSMFTVPGDMNSCWSCCFPCWIPSSYSHPTVSFNYSDKNIIINSDMYFPPSGLFTVFVNSSFADINETQGMRLVGNLYLQQVVKNDVYFQGYATNCTPFSYGTGPPIFVFTFYNYIYIYPWLNCRQPDAVYQYKFFGPASDYGDVFGSTCNLMEMGIGQTTLQSFNANTYENTYGWNDFYPMSTQASPETLTGSFRYTGCSGGIHLITVDYNWGANFGNVTAFSGGLLCARVGDTSVGGGENLLGALVTARDSGCPANFFGIGPGFDIFRTTSSPTGIAQNTYLLNSLSGITYNCNLGIVNFQRNKYLTTFQGGPPDRQYAVSGEVVASATFMWG